MLYSTSTVPAPEEGLGGAAGAFTITDEEFSAFRALVLKEAGIFLSDAKRQLVLSRLAKRLRHFHVCLAMLLPARSSALAEPKRAIEELCRGMNNASKVLRMFLEVSACAVGLLVYLAAVLCIILIGTCWQILFGPLAKRSELAARSHRCEIDQQPNCTGAPSECCCSERSGTSASLLDRDVSDAESRD